jgi:pantetheine-phosphate adenylyltransferase
MRIGIYPGSFDPLTYGHLDIIGRAVKICDKLIVGVLINSAKKSLFSQEEREIILRRCCSEICPDIEIVSFNGLLVDFCRNNNISCIIRGLRAVSDFEYEITIASLNRRLAPEIETIFLMGKDENLFISSTLVKEIAAYNGNISTLVHPYVVEKIHQKISIS